MITGKLGSKARTTVPQPVRVVVACAPRSPADDPFRSFKEWESDADRKAYGGL